MHLVLYFSTSESQKWLHSRKVFSQASVLSISYSGLRAHLLLPLLPQTLAFPAVSVTAKYGLKYQEDFPGQNSFPLEIRLSLLIFGALHLPLWHLGFHIHHSRSVPSFSRSLATCLGTWNDFTFKALHSDRRPWSNQKEMLLKSFNCTLIIYNNKYNLPDND